MRKYHVIDADGEEYQVEELDEDIIEEPEVHDEPEAGALSIDEIDALKRLAGFADKLIALVNTTDSDEDMNEEDLHDEDEEIIEDEDEIEEEEIIDTDEEEMIVKDSKKSFGAIERKKKKVSDTSLKDEVSDAWAKRYGGLR